MENPTQSRYATSFGLALAVASVINALLVMAKEKNPAVMAGMKRITGHHWTTHSAIVILLFLVLGWILSKSNGGQGVKLTVNNLIATLIGGVVLGGVLIVGFYLIGD